jgi:hypothetical protein
VIDRLHLSDRQGRATFRGSPDKRRDQTGRMHVSVLRHQKAGARVSRKAWLEATQLISGEKCVRYTHLGQVLPLPLELVDFVLVDGDLERPVAPVLNRLFRVARNPLDESVVLIEAADAKPQQGRGVPLDIGSQYAR